MRKTFLIAIGCFALAAVVWASNDPWKDKPYQQWDSKDLQKIFQDSPWAHVVRVDAPWMGGGGGDDSTVPAGSGAPGGRSMGGTSAGGGGNAGTDMGGGGGGTASFLVRWISSRTFREAMIRDRVLRSQMTEADAQTELAKPVEGYEVVVTGPDMRPFQSLDEDTLKKAAVLTPKHSKTKLTPTAVRIQKTQDGSKVAGVLYIFPVKSDNGEATIGTDEKNVEFSCTAGKFTLKWSFDVSKMADSQGRDL
jgi:hypothetical protein